MVKVQDLTADTSPTGDDLIFGTNNPGGTPGSRKWTLDNTLNYLLTRTQTWTGDNTFNANIDMNGNQITGVTLSAFSNDIRADEIHLQVRNQSGVTINKGDAVYISGYSVAQSLPLVGLANASSSSTMPAIGVVEDVSINNNNNGAILISGRITGINTNSLGAEGTVVYISTVGTTGNTLTSTKPTGTDLIQSIGEVLEQDISTGEFEIFGAGRANDMPNVSLHETRWLDTHLKLRNVANTFSVGFTNTVTADRTITLPDASGTIGLLGSTQTWTGVNTFSDNIILAATKKVFLDGGTNTSIRESAADTIALEAGGSDILTVSSSNITANTTLDMNLWEIDSVAFILSDDPNKGTDSDGFIRVGNSRSITWRNFANTANAKFEFDAADQFVMRNTLIGSDLVLQLDKAVPADFDVVGRVIGRGDDDLGNPVDFAKILFEADDVTSTTKDSSMIHKVYINNVDTTALIINDSSNAFNIFLDAAISSGNRFYLDGVSDTSIRESAADTMAFELNGIDRITISPTTFTTTIGDFQMGAASITNASSISSSTTATPSVGFVLMNNNLRVAWRNNANTADVYARVNTVDTFEIVHTATPTFGVTSSSIRIPATNRFYLDGGNNTYIFEESADVVTNFVGGATRFQITTTKLSTEEPLFMKEMAAAETDVASYGQIWVKNDTPNTLWFTDDAGTDVQLGVGGGGASVFGNGWDGSATNPALSASGVLVKHYTDLTINSPTTWSGTGVIIVKVSGTLNLTSTLTLTVDTEGTAGSAGGGGVFGGVGGKNRGIVIIMAKTITGTGTITSTGNNGANGSNGGPSSTTGTNGGSPSAGTSFFETSVTGATGGFGSTGSTGANGGTGSGTVKTGFGDIYEFLGVFHKIKTVGGGSGGGGAYGNSTGAGGGGGGGGASSGNFIETGTNGGKGGNGGGSLGGGGGAGGGGGGNAATLFLITSSVSAINVTLTGGTGGNGGSAYQFGDDSAGGGGGGAGGCVEYVLIANSNATINETLTGGTGGTGGALRGIGQNGTDGTTGNIQKIYLSYDSFLDLI